MFALLMPKGTAAVAYHWSYREKTRQPEQPAVEYRQRRISGGAQAAGYLCQTLHQNCTFFDKHNPKQRYVRRAALFRINDRYVNLSLAEHISH